MFGRASNLLDVAIRTAGKRDCLHDVELLNGLESLVRSRPAQDVAVLVWRRQQHLLADRDRGVPSSNCDSVGAGFLAPTSRRLDGGGPSDHLVGASGDYCNHYIKDRPASVPDPVGNDLSLITGLSVPNPASSYQMGDTAHAVCQATGSSWGMELKGATGDCARRRAGIHHWVSLHDQVWNDRPFASWYGDFRLPSLRISADFTVHTLSSGDGWGYVLPAAPGHDHGQRHRVLPRGVVEPRGRGEVEIPEWRQRVRQHEGLPVPVVRHHREPLRKHALRHCGPRLERHDPRRRAGTWHFSAVINRRICKTRSPTINARVSSRTACPSPADLLRVWQESGPVLVGREDQYALIGIEDGSGGLERARDVRRVLDESPGELLLLRDAIADLFASAGVAVGKSRRYPGSVRASYRQPSLDRTIRDPRRCQGSGAR